jgi:hypothetical protein
MTTLPPKVPHLVGTNKILLLEDVYQDIGDTCGISKIDGTPPDGAETASIRELIKNGTIRRGKVKLSNRQIRTIYMIAANCPKVAGLVTQNFTSGLTISNAWFPQTVSMY